MGNPAVHEKKGVMRMSKTNCINCGAAKDIDEIKCPFCGTTYLDFTAIDFSSNAPVVCEFVLPTQNKEIVQMVAIPKFNEISCSPVCCDFIGGAYPLHGIYGYDAEVGISFIPLAQKDGTIFKIRREKEA